MLTIASLSTALLILAPDSAPDSSKSKPASGSASECTYQSAFTKALADLETRKFGYTLELTCPNAAAEEKTAFKRGYNDGITMGPMLKAWKVSSIPSSKEELQSLLEDAEKKSVAGTSK